VFYGVVREQVETFLARARERDRPAPRFVERGSAALYRGFALTPEPTHAPGCCGSEYVAIARLAQAPLHPVLQGAPRIARLR
jgi:hypothetical protein